MAPLPPLATPMVSSYGSTIH